MEFFKAEAGMKTLGCGRAMPALADSWFRGETHVLCDFRVGTAKGAIRCN